MFFDGEKNDISKLERLDIASHFILRLAYCRTEDLRRWFITQESQLFRRRLEKLDPTNDRRDFMKKNGISFEIASPDARQERREKLLGLAGVTEANFLITSFYKIPFQQALSLISNRTVHLEAGYAWVPLEKLVSILVNKFKLSLSRSLAEAMIMFDQISSDSRIGPMLKNMNKQFLGMYFVHY